jgi:hypothetical protein
MNLHSTYTMIECWIGLINETCDEFCKSQLEQLFAFFSFDAYAVDNDKSVLFIMKSAPICKIFNLRLVKHHIVNNCSTAQNDSSIKQCFFLIICNTGEGFVVADLLLSHASPPPSIMSYTSKASSLGSIDVGSVPLRSIASFPICLIL